MNSLVIYITLLVVLPILFGSATKIAGESQRFAVFKFGRFQHYVGPGLVMVVPFVQKVHRLGVGDFGVMVGKEIARFGTIDIPLRNVESIREGQTVRIDGFADVEPKVVASSPPGKDMCPSCGHVF